MNIWFFDFSVLYNRAAVLRAHLCIRAHNNEMGKNYTQLIGILSDNSGSLDVGRRPRICIFQPSQLI
jgi:hypothetical protein